MVLEFIKEYTRPSGKVIKVGQLMETDETGQSLIDAGYAKKRADSTTELGCDAMLKNHLGGMTDNVQRYDPDPDQEQ